MKKLGKILLPIMCLSLGILSGCKDEEKTSSKIRLTFGDVNTQDVTDIKIGDLNSLVAQQQSFLFAVSPEGCVCWSEFHPHLSSYIKEHHLICYHMKYKEFEDYASTYKVVLTKGATTFVVFENGELKVSITSGEKNTTMKKKDEFYSFMDSIIEFPKCYYVSEANVDSILASDKTSVIYYKRSGCGDCTYLEPNILKPYIESHENMNNLYVLDCESWLSLENKGQANKDKYGLSKVNNPVYGYNNGYYPYFSLVENGQFKSGAEAFNVTIENKVITDSYYSQERADKLQYLTNVNTKVLTGLELSDADISSYGGWEHEKALQYYQPLINAFLDYALPQVTCTI